MGRVAYVLGGGGVHGAAEIGMLQALVAEDILPDLVVGTSIGAINGAVIAAGPRAAPARLAGLWASVAQDGTFAESALGRIVTLARTRTHLHASGPLRRLLEAALPVERFEDLQVPFQCVAAAIETSSSVWFSEGQLLEAVLASAAVPGLLAPVEIGGVHHYDGGLVHSIPLGRALELGAEEIYVLHVGRIEAPLRAPTSPWEVGLVTFEIARRHRFVEELRAVPADVAVHVLPSGDALGFDDPRGLRYREMSGTRARIERARKATADYLSQAG